MTTILGYGVVAFIAYATSYWGAPYAERAFAISKAEIGLLLGEPGAARGYPPSALATINRLVERAGNSAESGGSITGIYTVLADGDDEKADGDGGEKKASGEAEA